MASQKVGLIRDNRIVPFEREVKLATELAQEAGALVFEYQRRGITAKTKDDESPVTAADKACEKMIVERIAREFPEDGVLGEEGANKESRNGRKWIVDPIDGTRDFVRGIPLWAVLIGFEQNGEVVAGAAHSPGQQLLLSASKGGGTWQNGTSACMFRKSAIPNKPFSVSMASTKKESANAPVCCLG